jgi:hypothetical protein
MMRTLTPIHEFACKCAHVWPRTVKLEFNAACLPSKTSIYGSSTSVRDLYSNEHLWRHNPMVYIRRRRTSVIRSAKIIRWNTSRGEIVMAERQHWRYEQWDFLITIVRTVLWNVWAASHNTVWWNISWDGDTIAVNHPAVVAWSITPTHVDLEAIAWKVYAI